MYFQFSVALALTILALGVSALLIGLQKLLAPNNPYARKLMAYECGEPPTGRAWINFNVRFYLIALIFVIFEVEVAFIYPVAAVFSIGCAMVSGCSRSANCSSSCSSCSSG